MNLTNKQTTLIHIYEIDSEWMHDIGMYTLKKNSQKCSADSKNDVWNVLLPTEVHPFPENKSSISQLTVQESILPLYETPGIRPGTGAKPTQPAPVNPITRIRNRPKLPRRNPPPMTPERHGKIYDQQRQEDTAISTPNDASKIRQITNRRQKDTADRKLSPERHGEWHVNAPQ